MHKGNGAIKPETKIELVHYVRYDILYYARPVRRLQG